MPEGARVRNLLNRSLTTDADFNAFCRDCFPDVYLRYGDQWDRVAKTTLLLQVIADHELIERYIQDWLTKPQNERQTKQHSQKGAKPLIALAAGIVIGNIIFLACGALINLRFQPEHTSLNSQSLPIPMINQSDPDNTSQYVNNDSCAPPQDEKRVQNDRSKEQKSIVNIIQGNVRTIVQNL